MAHELEMRKDGTASMMAVGSTPWHGLGVVLQTPPATTEDAMRAAGLDWTVEKRPLYTPTTAGLSGDTSRARGVKLKDHFAVVRTSDDRPLGVVGRDYEPLQNSEAFRFMEPLIGSKEATFETAGSLKGGAVIWVLAKVNRPFEVIPGDGVRSYLLLTSSHDGSRLVQARYTPVRVVCQNTLSMATPRDAKRAVSDGAIRIRHTRTVVERVEAASEIMANVHRAALQTQEVFRALAAKQVKGPTVQQFLAELFPGAENATLSARTENIRREVLVGFEAGIGTSIPGVRGTAWGLYNAVTEYVDHSRGIPESGQLTRERAESRLLSTWFGDGQRLKTEALARLVAMV